MSLAFRLLPVLLLYLLHLRPHGSGYADVVRYTVSSACCEIVQVADLRRSDKDRGPRAGTAAGLIKLQELGTGRTWHDLHVIRVFNRRVVRRSDASVERHPANE